LIARLVYPILALCALGARPVAAQMFGELSANPVLVVEAGHAVRPPDIDGDLTDWRAVHRVPFYENGPHVSTRSDFVLRDDGDEPAGTARTPADLSGHFAVQWDHEAIYLAAWISDNVHDVEGRADFEWWYKDSVSLFLDVPRDGDGSEWREGDHAFSFIADPTRPANGAWWRRGDQGRQESPAPAGVRYEVRLHDGGYTVEAAIPMDLLAEFTPNWQPPFAGRTTGFMFIATDPDNGPDSFGGELIYGGDNDHDARWAALRLADGQAAPPHQESERTRAVLEGLQLPPGYRAEIYALIPGGPNRMAWHADGRLFVTVGGWGSGGKVVVVEDLDRDGAADRVGTFMSGLSTPLGLALRGDDMYLAHRSPNNRVSLVRDTDGDGRGEFVDHLITRLNGGHGVSHIAFGPDDKLYVTLGSSGDLRAGRHIFDATIFRMNTDGSDAELVAAGLRNAYGFDWDAEGRLFATDNGPDQIDVPYNDELNYIVPGRHYGFPFVYTHPERAAEFTEPVFRFAENASANGIAFYDGARFPELRGDAFVAIWGPADRAVVDLVNNPRPPWDAYYVARVEFADTTVARVSRFAGDFQHPLDVSVGPDGALYIVDWGSTGKDGSQQVMDRDGAIYRITRGVPTAVMADDSPPVASTFALGAGYPNPFNNTVSIPFSLARSGSVDLAVYNVAGQRVRTLIQGPMVAGEHRVRWEGMDDGGRRTATGIYFYRLKVAERVEVRKGLLLH